MEDVRLLLRVCVMLLPLPIFWALYDQQVLPASLTVYIAHIAHILYWAGLEVDASSHSDEWKNRKLHSSTRPDASYQCSSYLAIHSTV